MRTYYGLNNPFDKFKNVDLLKNHRQGNAQVYADLMKKIRFGSHDENDYQLLKSSLLFHGKVDKYKIVINEVNAKKLRDLEGTLYSVQAINKSNFKTNAVSTDEV